MAGKKKHGKHGRGVKTIEASAVPEPIVHKQSKRKGHGHKKAAMKKVC